jgi:streptogramin lyase
VSVRASWLPLLVLGCAPKAEPEDDDTPVTDPAELDAGGAVEVVVGTPATLRATGPEGAYTWDLGDGTRRDGAEVTHAWSEPGNLVATVSVVLPGGLRRTASVRVVAYLPAASPLPASSSSVRASDTLALVVEADADRLVAVDLATGRVSGVETCDRPRSVAVRDGTVAVACEGDALDRFTLGDDGTLADRATVSLSAGSRPFAVVPAEPGAFWVSLQGAGAVARVDAEGNATKTPFGPDPRALVGGGAGLWATRLRSAQTHGELLGADGPVPLALDPGPDSDTANAGIPTSLRAAVISPDGGTVIVGGTVANVVRGVALTGSAFPVDETLRATLRVVDTASRAERFVDRKQIDNQGSVDALALSPRGNWLFVAHAGTHTILRMDAYTLRAAGVILDAGAGIDGLAVTPDGTRLVVHAALDREVRVYDVADPSVPTSALLLTVPTVDVEPLDPVVLLGKRLFHDSRDTRLARDGYMACDTCHPDGRDDGLVWDFTQRGEGLRNTITLEGRAGTGMGPVHWTGNFDEIHDFEGDIRKGQGGSGLLSDDDWATTSDPFGPPKAGLSADLDALAAYVASLDATPPSPLPEPEGGAEAFDAAGCGSCHDPATRYTDSAAGVRHDVGTWRPTSGQRLGLAFDGFDTPTLLGVHATAPYLHDGSAPSVEDAVRAHAGTDGLDGGTVSRIAEFVRSL